MLQAALWHKWRLVSDTDIGDTASGSTFPAAIVLLIKRCHMLRAPLLSENLIANNATLRGSPQSKC